MSFFDDASLVMIPSGYKDQKVYSVKPIDGTGDLTFTRSNDTATRVNSSGLIEKVRTNLMPYSQNFISGFWSKNAVTITADSIANPLDGVVNASKWTASTANTAHYLLQTVGQASGTVIEASFYVKANGYNYCRLEDGQNSAGIWADLSTGTITSGTGGTLTALANGWYRISIKRTVLGTNAISPVVGFAPTANLTYIGDGTSGGYVYGCQLEVSDFGPTDYIPTTSAAVSVGPVANLPRIDYTGGGCGKLLLEPQRTNVHLLSETMYEMPRFALAGAVLPTNARSLSTVSPSGYYNATELTGGNGSTGSWGIYNLIPTSISAGNQVSVSTFAKAGTHDKIFLSQANISYTGTNGAYFDLSNGTTPTAGARMEYYGNGWWRCFMPVVTLTANSPSSYNIGHYVAPSTSSNVWSTNYNGKSVYFFGTQVEAGGYSTSYIPTISAAVTRGADAAYKTGISSLIGQTEGTFFVDFEYLDGQSGNNENWLALESDAGNDRVLFYKGSTVSQRILIQVNGSNVYQNSYLVAISAGTRYKLAVRYNSGDIAVYVNGSQIATDATTYTRTDNLNNITFNESAQPLSSRFNQMLVFPEGLTNAQLAELTTL